MDANTGINNSWNPMCYTQNLCVVKKSDNSGQSLQTSLQNTRSFINNNNNNTAITSNTNIYASMPHNLIDSCDRNQYNNQFNNHFDNLFENQLSTRFADYCNLNANPNPNPNPNLDSNMTAKYMNDYIHKFNDSLVNRDVIGGDNATIKSMHSNSANVFGKSLNCGDFTNMADTQKSPVYSFNVNANPFYSRNSDMFTEMRDSKHYSMIPSMKASNINSLASHLIGNMDHSSQLTERKSHLLPYDMLNNESLKFHSNSYSNSYSNMNANSMAIPTNTCIRPMRSIRARTLNSSCDAMNKLNHFMDRCYEQFRLLEKERKKAENELSMAFGGHKISSANNIPIQRAPQNATRIDRLLADMSREHAKVITIIAKMEHLRGSREFTDSIHNVIQKWLEIIRKLQLTRKEEMITSVSNYGLVADIFYGQVRDLVKDLSLITRSVRTAIWCALVLTIANPQQHNQIY